MDRYQPVDNANAERRSIYDEGKYRNTDWVADKLNTLTEELAATEKVMNKLVDENRFYVEIIEKLETKLAVANDKIEKLKAILRCIENTPPKDFKSIEGKTEHWWARLVNYMHEQAASWKSGG